MSLQLLTAPVKQPLDWDAEVKTHLRLDSEDERPRVDTVLVPAAKDWCEGFTNRALISQTWKLYLDHFPGAGHFGGCCSVAWDRSVMLGLTSGQRQPIEIPKPPLRSITHIKYYDADGVLQTWSSANYEIDPPIAATPLYEPTCQPYRVWPAYGQSYPATQPRRNAVEIQFVCGYGTNPADVPGKLRAAMLLMVAEQFERREQSRVGNTVQEYKQTAERLAWPFRVRLFAEAS